MYEIARVLWVSLKMVISCFQDDLDGKDCDFFPVKLIFFGY